MIGTYLSLLRYSTICNEVNGSIITFLKFLGHTKVDYENIHKRSAKLIRDALITLAKGGYIHLDPKYLAKMAAKTHFIGKFGASQGWRAKPSSLDAKFSFSEIENASTLAKQIKWTKGDMCHILQLVIFLRQRADASAVAYAKIPQEQRNICVIDFDDTCEWFGWSRELLEERLRIMRRLKLGAFRVVWFELKGVNPHFPGKRIRFLISAPHSRKGMDGIKDAFKRLKEIYKDAKVVYDTSNPNIRDGSLK